MDAGLFEAMTLAAKKNALVVCTGSRSYIGDYWYTEVIETLQNDRRLKMIDSADYFKFDRLQ